MRVAWKQTGPTRAQRRVVKRPWRAALVGGPGVATVSALILSPVVLPLSRGWLLLLVDWVLISVLIPLNIWLLCRQVRRWDTLYGEPRTAIE